MVEKLKSLIKKLFILNNSKFKVIMITMLLFIKFIMSCFIWLPQDGSHLGHSVWALLLGNQTHYFQPTSQFWYWVTKNLGSTRCISINNAKSNSMHNVLFVSLNTDNSCHQPLVLLTFVL